MSNYDETQKLFMLQSTMMKILINWGEKEQISRLMELVEQTFGNW